MQLKHIKLIQKLTIKVDEIETEIKRIIDMQIIHLSSPFLILTAVWGL